MGSTDAQGGGAIASKNAASGPFSHTDAILDLPEGMKLVEKKFLNHHIEIYQDSEDNTLIKLLDESGEGGFVDPSKPATGNHCVWLTCGYYTCCSVSEIAFLSTKIPLSFTIHDQDGESYIVDHFFLPVKEEDREMLLSADERDVRDAEVWMLDDRKNVLPDWVTVWKKVTTNKTRSLF